jgi:cyclopropane-fatty-acyl-phospholipid synthase
VNVARESLPLPDYAPGLTGLAERGLLPDALLRLGIRRQCEARLREESAGTVEEQAQRFSARIVSLSRSPLALHVDAANRQHYEVPAAFFQDCLGARL